MGDLNLRNGKSASLVSIAQENRVETAPHCYLHGLIDVLTRLPVSLIDEVVERLYTAYQQNSTLYLFGNGGSAALASHVACDLGKGTMTPSTRPFRVVSLCDNVPLMTAWANDASYEEIFAAQLKALLVPGDIAFAISGSGNSPNVRSALQTSREGGGFNIGLTGFSGGKMQALCDCCVVVPSQQMQHIEDSHVCIMHSVFLAFRERIQSTARVHAASM
jgi:D-sedoheptulose 7-phosphate isomerase